VHTVAQQRRWARDPEILCPTCLTRWRCRVRIRTGVRLRCLPEQGCRGRLGEVFQGYGGAVGRAPRRMWVIRSVRVMRAA